MNKREGNTMGEQTGAFEGEITVVGADEFRALIPQLVEPLCNAYRRPPRDADYTIPEPGAFLRSLAEQDGFSAYVASASTGEPMGVLAVDTPHLDMFEERWGDAGPPLADFVAAKMREDQSDQGAMAIVCVREFFSSRPGAGKAMAEHLVRTAKEKYPEGAVLLARVREDDVSVRGLATVFGGKEIEGLRMSSKRGAPLSFWYRVVPARS